MIRSECIAIDKASFNDFHNIYTVLWPCSGFPMLCKPIAFIEGNNFDHLLLCLETRISNDFQFPLKFYVQQLNMV